MKCVVTAGPTFEPLDRVRRLTNFSTGRLGSELANYLVDRGHEVTLLLGELATFAAVQRAQSLQRFSTTADLASRLCGLSSSDVHAVFHAAAVSDFTVGRVFRRSAEGGLVEVHSGKYPTSAGLLLAELTPTSKILPRLRDWFDRAFIVGWKYEVDGDAERTVQLGRRQTAESRSDACVANGPAYGDGFGLVLNNGGLRHLAGAVDLYEALRLLAEVRSRGVSGGGNPA